MLVRLCYGMAIESHGRKEPAIVPDASAKRWSLPGPSDPSDLSAASSRALLARPEMQRLRGLRLLGALDYLDDHPFHTRWEHSIGVAVLAEVVGQLLELDEAQFETFSAAALLHDIGHSPLSHTLHDLLEETLGFSHRSLGVDLVLGKKSFPGVEAPLNRFLENLNVNPTDVASIIIGER